jgi:hypothetical protein
MILLRTRASYKESLVPLQVGSAAVSSLAACEQRWPRVGDDPGLVAGRDEDVGRRGAADFDPMRARADLDTAVRGADQYRGARPDSRAVQPTWQRPC